MNITDHLEFRVIMEDAYKQAYSHGQQDERERCARSAEDVNQIVLARKIRSGK